MAATAAPGPAVGVGKNKVAPAPTDEKPAPDAAKDEGTEINVKESAEADEDEAEKDSKQTDDAKSKSARNAKRKKMEKQRNKKRMKNGCQKCCGTVMSFMAQDAIYGSFFGPHPVSFLFICSLLKKKCPCTKKCSKPLCVASIATKIMNFIMLGIVALLAGFFIIPWPEIPFLSANNTAIASFYPCQPNKMIRYQAANGGCVNHAGYFMAYRCFFAYVTVMLTYSLLMVKVTSTKDDPYRSRVHHGFWFYKYLYLTCLLFIYFFMVNGESDKEGVFEFTASVIGNMAHMVFSIVEITFILDLVELWVYENRTGRKKWATFIYGTNTFLVLLAGSMVYIKIWVDFSSMRAFSKDNRTAPWPPWPLDNCEEGFKTYPDWQHVGIILGSTSVIILLIIVTAFRKILRIDARFPNTGWLQTGVLILFDLSYLWSALTNSSNIHSRPHCNGGLNAFENPRNPDPTVGIRRGSYDQYFLTSGLFHAILCLLALLYFAFVHGPRSSTAPFSILYSFIFPVVDRIPVYPDEEDEEMAMPLGFLMAIDQSKVWDDEQVSVAQSWSLFYFMMIIGSLSLMMAMTNFTNPWAADHYNSSNVALGCKFGTSVIATGLYIIMLRTPCTSLHANGLEGQRMRKRSVKEILDFQFDFSELDEGEGLEKLQADPLVKDEDAEKPVDTNTPTTVGGDTAGKPEAVTSL